MKAAVTGVQRGLWDRIVGLARAATLSPVEMIKSVLGFIGGLIMLLLGLAGAAVATVVGIVVGFLLAVIPVLVVSGLIQAVCSLFFV